MTGQGGLSGRKEKGRIREGKRRRENEEGKVKELEK